MLLKINIWTLCINDYLYNQAEELKDKAKYNIVVLNFLCRA